MRFLLMLYMCLEFNASVCCISFEICKLYIEYILLMSFPPSLDDPHLSVEEVISLEFIIKI